MLNTHEWYAALAKPTWAPPAWLFGPVWTFLYVIIAVSFGTVFYKIWNGQLPKSLAWPFALNLFFNLIFTPLQFGLKNNYLAAIDILLILGTIIWFMWAIYPRMQWVVWVNIPYLLWVSFATVLQLTIVFLNFKR